jgi:hypothetical protein
VDHQAAASLKEDVAKEASDVVAAAATMSGGNVPKRGRKFSSVLGNRRKTPTPSVSSPDPSSLKILTSHHARFYSRPPTRLPRLHAGIGL